MVGGRGNNRARGGGRGGIYKNHDRNVPIHDRLGKMAVYQKNNDRTSKEKYRYVKHPVSTHSIATLPPDTRIKMLAKKFLKAYYEIFDQVGRINLESQYSTDAFFSFSATLPMPIYGRNLLEVHEAENRISLLVHDKTNIARALATFSPTEHLVNFLTIDIPYYIVNPMSVISMQIIVTGVFKDTSQTTNPLKAFTRVFVLKQESVDDQGDPIYKIFNDLFMLQPPTPDQIKKYHHDSQINKPSTNQPGKSNSSTNSDTPSARQQEQMIQSIMAKTRMNRAGARQLLNDCKWDETESMNVFNRLSAVNQIPQELFTP